MATEDEIAALKDFCETETLLKQEESGRKAENRKSMQLRNNAMQKLLEDMQRANVVCVTLPEEFDGLGKYARLTQSHATRCITGQLVRKAIAEQLTRDRVEAVVSETSASVTDVVEASILRAVRDRRTTTKDIVTFCNHKPRHVDADAIIAAPQRLIRSAQEVRRLKEAHAAMQDRQKESRAPLEERRNRALTFVQQYMDRMERNSQPIIAIQGGEKAFVRRKITHRKAPLLVNQFKAAVSRALTELQAQLDRALRVEDVEEHRDALTECIVEGMEGLRLEQQHETFTLDSGRKRSRE